MKCMILNSLKKIPSFRTLKYSQLDLHLVYRSSCLSLSILYLQTYSTKVKQKNFYMKNVRYNTHIYMTKKLIGKKHRLCNYTSVFDLQMNVICNIFGVFHWLLFMISHIYIYTNWIDLKFQDRLLVHELNCCLVF